MRKSHFNDELLVLLGPIISRLFTCSNEEKTKTKKQKVLALVLSLWAVVARSVVMLIVAAPYFRLISFKKKRQK